MGMEKNLSKILSILKAGGKRKGEGGSGKAKGIKERRGRTEGGQRNQWCSIKVVTEEDERERK